MNSSVLNVGKYEIKGKRPTMEDVSVSSYISFPSLPLDNRLVEYLALFDGHSGKSTADYAAGYLKEEIEKSGSFITDECNAIENAFMNMDENWRTSKKLSPYMIDSGCTAIVCIITGSKIICANLGDSRCILGRSNEFIALSTDHKPNLPEEENRIRNAGSFIRDNRVRGMLAVSRAFGDFDFKTSSRAAKDHAVTAFPEVKLFDRLINDKFLVLACDGLWDVLSNREVYVHVIDEMKKGVNVFDMAESLVWMALAKGSTDNISCIVKLF